MNINKMASEISPLNAKITKIFKSSLVYGLTSSLQSVLGFVLLPILTIYYTPEIFGVYSILLLLSALTSAIFYLGASSALGRFYYEEDSDLYKRKIFTTALIVTLIGAFILISCGLIFAKPLSVSLFETGKYYLPIILILIATSFGFLLNLMTLLLRYENKAGLFFKIIISGVLVNFIVTYSLLSKFNFGILAPIYGILISNSLSFLILVLIKFKDLTKKLEMNHFKLIISFGIKSSFAGLSFYLLDWIDRLIINELLDLNDVGLYSLGYRLGAIINILIIVPFSFVWGPARMQYAKSKMLPFFTTKVVSYYTLIGVFILSATILFGEDILKIFFINKSYTDAMLIVPIIMFSLLFYGYGNIIDFGIYINNKIHYYPIIAIFLILFNVTFNFWLIPVFGYQAAAYVTLITYFLSSSIVFFISNFHYFVKIETTRVFSALIIIPILYYIVNFSTVLNLSIRIMIALTILLMFYTLWLNQKERAYIIYGIKKLVNIKK